MHVKVSVWPLKPPTGLSIQNKSCVDLFIQELIVKFNMGKNNLSYVFPKMELSILRYDIFR